MTQPSRLSSLGRRLDPKYPTNRVIMGLLPLTWAVVAAWDWVGEGAGMAEALVSGATGALALLGGWALARELDPDADRVAFLAAGFALATWLVLGGALAPLFLALLLARIVNRTTGLAARHLDSAFTLLATVAVIWLGGNPLYGVPAALAFGLDARLEPALERHGYFAIAALLAASAMHVLGLTTLPSAPTPGIAAVLVGAAVAGLAAARALSGLQVGATGDATGLPLSPLRVGAGFLVVVIVAVAGTAGDPGQAYLVWVPLAVIGGGLPGRRTTRNRLPDRPTAEE